MLSVLRRVQFEEHNYWMYNQSFALDPVNLPLSSESFFTTKRGGLFGVLADTTPDRWGQRLMRLTRQSPVGVLGGVPTIGNCLSRSGEFGLSQDAPQAIAGRVVERMRNWRDAFRALEVSRNDNRPTGQGLCSASLQRMMHEQNCESRAMAD
jgi:hypothetical protein